jgi:hypothetical protein
MWKFTQYIFVIFSFFSAQSIYAAPEEPEQVVSRYHSRFETERWLALLDFIHPDELQKFKEHFLSLFNDDNKVTQQSLIDLYGSGVTIQSLKAASATEYMQPILSMANRSLDASNLRITSQVILGTVEEGELRHVIYRWNSETPTLKMSQVEVRTLRRYGDTWRLKMPMNIENSLLALKRSIQQPK